MTVKARSNGETVFVGGVEMPLVVSWLVAEHEIRGVRPDVGAVR